MHVRTTYEQIHTYVATYKRELLTCHVALHQLIRPTGSHVSNLTYGYSNRIQ